MKKFKILVLLLTLAAAAFAFRPVPVNGNLFATVAFKLYEYFARYPQEKIFLHHDKTVYSLGESIWFKAYLTLAPAGTADTLSNILYVDLVNIGNDVVLTRKLRVEAGTAHGDMALPDTLSEGIYQLRAYTNWMRNFSTDYFFTKELTVVNPKENAIKAGITHRALGQATGTGEYVISTLVFYQLPYKPLPRQKFKFHVLADGKRSMASTLETDEQGQITFTSELPKAKKGVVPQAVLVVEAAAKDTKFKQSFQLPSGGADLDLQFFPESGNWVTEAEARLAFKAIDRSGKGKDVEGAIYDQDGAKVADFKSEHLGMGQLLLKPESGKVYEARITQADGYTAVFPLPETREKGVTLSLSRTENNQIRLRILNKRTGIAQHDSLYVVAHARNKIFFAAKGDPALPEIVTNLPLTRFPPGLVYFTVFNRAGYPLCERLAFVNMPQPLHIALTTDKATYGQREQVKMLVEVKGADGIPVANGNFSLAVRDSRNDSDPYTPYDDIYAYTYLSSELKGQVEQVGYYFDPKNPNAARHLDLLLLTQGWRRFSWPDVMQEKQPAITFALEKEMSFSGHVEKEYGRNKDAGTTNLTIVATYGSGINRSKPVFTLAPTAEDGSFYIGGLDSYDTLNMFIQARTLKGGKNLMIKRNMFAPPELAFTPAEDATVFKMLNEAYLRSINNWARSDRSFRLASGAILLDEVEVKADKVQPDTRRLHSIHFTDAVIKVGEDKVIRNSIFDYLLGIAGVQVTGGGMNQSVSIRGAAGPPVFVVDGMVLDLDFVQSLPPTDVETIEVLKGANAAVYPNASNGAIVIFTKRGNPNYDHSKDPISGALAVKLPGYYKAQEFYVPRYDVPDDRHNLPDFRNTLHWQPQVTTNAAGKAEITFYTSDDVTGFTASCQGFDGQGAVGAGTHSFKVGLKR